MHRKPLYLLLLWLATTSIYAQKPNLDSLKSIWQDQSQSDSIRLLAIYKISRDGFVFTQPDSAIHYAKKHYELAKDKDVPLQMALALNTQGEAHYGMGKYDEAYDLYSRCLEIAEEQDDQQRIASTLNNMALIHEIRGDYVQALEVYARSLNIFETLKHQLGIVGSLNNIGVVYQIQGDYSKAIEFYSRSLAEGEKLGNKRYILTFLNNIGLVHRDHQNLDKAIEYFLKALKIAEEIDYPPGVAFTLNNLGSAYQAQENHESALDNFQRCLDIRLSLGDQQGQVSTLANMGSIYLSQGKLSMAMNNHEQSLQIAEEIGYSQGIASALNNIANIHLLLGSKRKAIEQGNNSLKKAQQIGSIKEIKAASETLHKAYAQSGNYKASLEMYHLYDQMRDSIANIEGQKEALQQEFRRQLHADSLAFANQRQLDLLAFEADQKEARAQKVVLLIGFILILLSIFVYMRISHIKKTAERRALLQEIKLLKIESVIKTAANAEIKEKLTLDKEKIEAAINNSLNQSDWNILNTLFDNPAIGNRQLADHVSLSVAGVRSSLQKMYRYFYIDQSANQRMLLVMEATKMSSKP